MTDIGIRWQERFLEKFYRSKSAWIDGTTEFHILCSERIAKGGKILEIGAGPSNKTSRFLATLGDVVGLDIDGEVTGNDALKQAVVCTGTEYPFPDASFDAVVSNYVLEHVAAPQAHLREVYRVLKPGGCYIFRTPNLYHYVSLIARATPHWVHMGLVHRLDGRVSGERHDPYPTFHRMNSRQKIRQFAASIGFTVEELRMVEKEPSYGMVARPVFLLFMSYERIVNSTDALAGLRANIFGVLSKPCG